jgi:hypothetical protein
MSRRDDLIRVIYPMVADQWGTERIADALIAAGLVTEASPDALPTEED